MKSSWLLFLLRQSIKFSQEGQKTRSCRSISSYLANFFLTWSQLFLSLRINLLIWITDPLNVARKQQNCFMNMLFLSHFLLIWTPFEGFLFSLDLNSACYFFQHTCYTGNAPRSAWMVLSVKYTLVGMYIFLWENRGTARVFPSWCDKIIFVRHVYIYMRTYVQIYMNSYTDMCIYIHINTCFLPSFQGYIWLINKNFGWKIV